MIDLSDVRPGGMDLNRVHPEWANLSADEIGRRCREKMEQYVDMGRKRATGAVEAIIRETPKDDYVQSMGMQVLYHNDVNWDGKSLFSTFLYDKSGKERPREVGFHQHALDQLAERSGLNVRYMHDLQAKGSGGMSGEWARQLLVHNFNELLARKDKDENFLLRQVSGQIRGCLSDAYKCIDSRPTLDALMEGAALHNLAIVDGTYAETKVSLKFVSMKPIEVFPNEWMLFGFDYTNSDYGDGAREFASFLLRLRCLNGAQILKALRRIHVGRRHNDDLIRQRDTLEQEARLQSMEARDAVNTLVNPAVIDGLVKTVRLAAEKPITPPKIEEFVKKHLLKTEGEKVKERFNAADVDELPAGQNVWRFSNALSWLAKNTEDPKRKLELERMSGKVIDPAAVVAAPAPADA